jgi:hypothetical protein
MTGEGGSIVHLHQALGLFVVAPLKRLAQGLNPSPGARDNAIFAAPLKLIGRTDVRG